MNNYLEQFKENGYFIVENAITETQANRFRSLCDNYFDNHPTSPFMDGFTVPAWAGNSPELDELNTFHEDPMLLDFATLALGCDDFLYTGHSDLHKNIVTLWHRDHYDYKLGCPETSPFRGFDEKNFWSVEDESKPHCIEKEELPDGFWDDDHSVIKIGFLLQDHKDNDLGLWMMSGSQEQGVQGKETCLHSSPRDLIVFDHRIMHRGQLNARQFHKEYDQDRILLAWGYGVDNKHTHQFMLGCNERQQFYRTKM